jgi:hypothetical protein
LRAVNVAIVADILRAEGELAPEARARTEELLSGVARAWYAQFWSSGVQPSHGLSLTTSAAPERSAYSLAGRQVAATVPTTFRWDADKGNSPSEELAWMGAGVMLATQVIRPRLPVEEAEALFAAGRHYASFAVAYDRPDPQHGGVRIRTLNAETSGGAYGQRRYWIENHTHDVPSIPYLGWTWHYLDAALLASEHGGQRPWSELLPNDAQWEVLKASAEATLQAPDGIWLVDFTPGRGVGFQMLPYLEWAMPCGLGRSGRHYVQYDGRAGGPRLFVSEIGHPAGLDLIAAAWPYLRLSIDRSDEAAYDRWADRLRRTLAEYIENPPDPAWAVCGVAPYVSHNPGYHWPRMLSMLVMAYLGASGYVLQGW